MPILTQPVIGVASSGTVPFVDADILIRDPIVIDAISMENLAGLPATFEVLIGEGEGEMGSPVSLGQIVSDTGGPVSWSNVLELERGEVLRGRWWWPEAQGLARLFIHFRVRS